MKDKIQRWIDKNGIQNYFLFDDRVSFQFLVSDNRKRFLSYCKRLFGDKILYDYSSKERVERHLYKGFSVTINNY